MPALHTPPILISLLTSAWFPSKCRGILQSIGQGRYKRSLMITEMAMMMACETSEPLIPARMLIPFVENVDSRAM